MEPGMKSAFSRIRGVVMDMDGTCTNHYLNFGLMRSRLAELVDSDAPLQGDILDFIESQPADIKNKSFKILEQIEAEAWPNLCLQDGLVDLIVGLEGRNIRRGILTRNTANRARMLSDMLKDHVPNTCSPFEVFVGRDSRSGTRVLKPKPFAEPLHHIREMWNLSPEEILMVGDSPEDVLCGVNAGCGATVLLMQGKNIDINGGCLSGLNFHVVESLRELARLLLPSKPLN